MRNLKKDPIKLGILGCGSFATRRILPAAQEAGIIKITCLQKRDLAAGRKIAETFHIPHVVTSRDELLSHLDVEAVMICTPNHMHEEDALACAFHKMPTLCEKPLAPTSLAIKNMLQAFQNSYTLFFVGHSLRFKPCVLQTKKLLQEHALGELLRIRVHFSIPVPKESWKYKKAFGGGVLQDIGVHLIDFIHFISDQEIISISAMANIEEVDQTVLASFRLSNGALASLECSFESPLDSGFEVVGSKSRLVSYASLRQTLDPVESFCHILEDGTKVYFPVQASNVYVEELKHFATSIIEKKSSIIPAEIALKNALIIEEIYTKLLA
ncbi:MAG: Gfo/Idh/MocA family oxidoreductase [Chlamydiales bacterium]|nr:Gfo/Idh/MocA family oxidoreductase [Chlamydiales bacterium]